MNIVQLLIEDNPDCIDQFDFTNQTPLILAAKNGFENVVLYLLNEQADSTLKDTSGYSAFDWAVKNERPEVVEVFLYREDWKEVKHLEKKTFNQTKIRKYNFWNN